MVKSQNKVYPLDGGIKIEIVFGLSHLPTMTGHACPQVVYLGRAERTPGAIQPSLATDREGHGHYYFPQTI